MQGYIANMEMIERYFDYLHYNKDSQLRPLDLSVKPTHRADEPNG